jgi:hypothetical protein
VPIRELDLTVRLSLNVSKGSLLKFVQKAVQQTLQKSPKRSLNGSSRGLKKMTPKITGTFGVEMVRDGETAS